MRLRQRRRDGRYPRPLCQANVEVYLGQINKPYGTKFDIPVLYGSLLMTMA